MTTPLPLIFLYWGRIRNDLPWLILAVVILSIPQWQSITDFQALAWLDKVGRMLTVFLPLLCITFALRWFSWSIDSELLDTPSNLPPYLATAPIPTFYLTLLPALGGILVAILGWGLFELGELPQGETFNKTESILRKQPNTHLAITLIGLSSYCWLQAITWQHFSRRGMRLIILILTQVIYFTVAVGWLINRSIPIIPIWLITLSWIVSILYSLRVIYLARHDVEIERPWFRQSKNNLKQAAQPFLTPVAAQSYCDWRLHWYEFPVIAVLIGSYCIKTLGYNLDSLVPWHIFTTSFFFALLVIPMMMAWFSGIDFGVLRTHRANYHQRFESFFSVLPLSTGQFVSAKVIASVKTLWMTYTLLLILAVLCHYRQVEGFYLLWEQRFGMIETVLLLGLTFVVMVSLIGLLHVGSFLDTSFI